MAAIRTRNDDSNLLDFARQNVLGGYDLTQPSAMQSPGPQALIDTVPGDTGTTAVLTVDAAPTISAIDTIADEDFYQITLVAGHQYQIGMYGYTPQAPGDPVGPNGAPLIDSFIELYDSAGNIITSADGGSDTTFNTANSGFDALLTFTATEGGTYFINARAFDNIPVDGDNGDLVGDYGLYAKDVTDDPSVFTPYYDANSPLYAIDWGTRVNKVNQSAANPDGHEGTRATGNPQGTPDYGDGLDIAGLAAAQGVDTTGKNVITIYFAQAGDIFVSNDPTNPGLPPATITATGVQQFEHDAVITALGEFAKVADIVYLEVDNRDDADFVYTSYQGTPGPGISLLGSMSPPDESDEGLAQFNSGDSRWNATDLQQGGFSFVTLIHEFGHGHGLAHPHDNGGHSGIMHGVEPEGAGVADYTTGDFALNQGVFTMMSYEDGWQSSPYGNAPTTGGYGYLGGLMAFDIAAIQDKYGVNEEWATGNDTYVMKDVNAPGTYFTSIWDAGGIDTIVYRGARNANIDLRAATLQYETGGGGRVSYANGIFGGFTIANGVTIERAVSGSGNDILTGNSADNALDGGAGNDGMAGGLGNDLYFVDTAGDIIVEAAGEGRDKVYTSTSYTLGVEVEDLSIVETAGARNGTGNGGANVLTGNSFANSLSGLAGSDVLIGNGGNDALDGGLGNDQMFGGAGDDIYFVDGSGDRITEAAGEGRDKVYAIANATLATDVEDLTLQAGAGAATATGNGGNNVVTGNAAANTLSGLAGDDVLIGNDGADTLVGGLGKDQLSGGNGADNFRFDAAPGSANADRILDFVVVDDTIQLDHAAFTSLSVGALSAGAFVNGTAAGDANDRILYDSSTGALYYDADGAGGAAAVQFATVTAGTALTASDFLVI